MLFNHQHPPPPHGRPVPLGFKILKISRRPPSSMISSPLTINKALTPPPCVAQPFAPPYMSASYLSYHEMFIVKLYNLLPQPFIDLSICGSRRPMVIDYIILDSIRARITQICIPHLHTPATKGNHEHFAPVPCPHVDQFLIPHSLNKLPNYTIESTSIRDRAATGALRFF
jgi:hypothetical protein